MIIKQSESKICLKFYNFFLQHNFLQLLSSTYFDEIIPEGREISSSLPWQWVPEKKAD